ncbi:MAG: stage III sporulation protein AC [Alkaliphilus sp.]|nr:MAG: stage III sporulation protein AC [Alkaliphilus sp.]
MGTNVDLIFRIAIIGILVSIINRVLVSAGREEQAMMTSLVGIIIVLMMVIELVNSLFETIKTMFMLY